MTRAGKNAVFSGLVLLLMAVVFEVASFAAGKVLQRKWAMWRVPVSPPEVESPLPYAQYLQRRDPVLGWPFPSQYGDDLDVNGAQWNPYFPEGPAQESCVSLYGDSFTEGGDVSSPKKTWGNRLSKKLHCYVANFGFGGYGTDQAFLRFRENRNDPSPIVILGLHTDDVLRNLTRIRDLANYEKWYALKPRFILDGDGKLELVPIPDLTEDEYLRVLTEREPPLELAHESLQPGGPAGVVKLEFPFTISLIRNMLGFYGFRSRLLGQPEWLELLQPGHALHGLEITAGITREFTQVAQERGKRPVVVILPHPSDFTYYAKKERWPYDTLLEVYQREQIPFIDVGPYFFASATKGDRKLDDYFGPTGHYNDHGNALVARFVYDQLTRSVTPGSPTSSARSDRTSR